MNAPPATTTSDIFQVTQSPTTKQTTPDADATRTHDRNRVTHHHHHLHDLPKNMQKKRNKSRSKTRSKHPAKSHHLHTKPSSIMSGTTPATTAAASVPGATSMGSGATASARPRLLTTSKSNATASGIGNANATANDNDNDSEMLLDADLNAIMNDLDGVEQRTMRVLTAIQKDVANVVSVMLESVSAGLASNVEGARSAVPEIHQVRLANRMANTQLRMLDDLGRN